MLQGALQFFRSDLIFPLLPRHQKKQQNTTMTEPPPPQRSPDCAPHEVTQNNLLQGDEDNALSHTAAAASCGSGVWLLSPQLPGGVYDER